MKTLHILAALVAGFILCTGCATDSGYVEPGKARVDSLGQAGLKVSGRFNYQGVIRPDEDNLRKLPGQELYFENIVGRKLANGLLEVQLVVANRSTLKGASVQYSIHWYDESGVEMNADSAGWSTLELQAAETATIRGVSLTPGAAKVTVFVREITYSK
jgi:hypothetical protein